MKLTIADVADAPEELHEQTHFVIKQIEYIPGTEKLYLWLRILSNKLGLIDNRPEQIVTHILITARWLGISIVPNVNSFPIGISFLSNQFVFNNETLDLKKVYT